MVTSNAQTPEQYIASLPEDRAAAVRDVRHVRFKRVDDLLLDVIGETIARANIDEFLAHFRAARGSSRRTRSADHGHANP
ncbi:MAG: hypothetical protein ABIW50_08140 [Candidatus Limnocylindria bacterium]